MEKHTANDNKDISGNAPKTEVVLIATGIALGIGAVAWLLKRRHDTKLTWDPEKVLDACDAAAAKLDEILFTETRHAG